MPWVDFILSGICLTAMGVFIVFILNHWPEVIHLSRIRVAIWLWAIVGIITTVFLVQTSLALHAIIKRGEGFRIDPLKIPYFDIVMATMAFGISSYIFLDFDQFILRAGHITLRDLMVGLIAIPLILEGTRRSIGVPLMVIALFALAYCYLGPYLVGVPLISEFAHRGYSVRRIIDHMYSGTEGIYGIPVGVVATYRLPFRPLRHCSSPRRVWDSSLSTSPWPSPAAHPADRPRWPLSPAASSGPFQGSSDCEHRRIGQFHDPHDEEDRL